MSFQAVIQRRWTDLDAQGHANNTAFAEYFQEARIQLLSAAQSTALAADCIVVENQIEFLKSIPYSHEPLQATGVVTELHSAKFVLEMELFDAGHQVGRTRLTCCPYEKQTRLPRRLDESEKAYLESLIEPRDPWRDIPQLQLNGAGDRYEFFPRWSDLDANAHVNNVRFFDFIQEARIAAMTSASGTMARIGTSSWGEGELPSEYVTWLLVRQDVNYLAQLVHRLTSYLLLTAPIKVGSSSITYQAEVIDPQAGDAVLARARSVVVAGDENFEPRALPDDMRAVLSAGLVAPS